ncbi:hypothetical protein ACIPJK_39065 [Streptomyces roseus]|uniref:hypothetical protein n=1 Tax=Streptomyces roseus TaxID=66430 RepID=UPI00382E612B
MGKTRYVNLHQCAYNAPGVDIITSIQPNIANTNFTAGTNLSNTPNNAISCGPGGAGYSLAPTLSSVQALDLLGKRYVNLQQCVYNASGVDIITNIQPNVADAQFATGTDTSNTADTLSCGPGGGGYALAPTLSATQPLDLLNNRYVNLHQCVYNAPGFDILTNIQPNITDAAYVGGTDASNTADSALSCGPGGGGYNFEPTLSSFQSFDTLDATRGEGFVEYTMIAPVVPATQTFTQDSTLNGPGTGTPSSSGTVTVDPALAIPLVDGFVAGTAALAGALGAAWSGYRRRIFRNIP